MASQDSRHIFSCQGAIKWTIFIFICVKWPSCISPADVSIYLYAPVFVLFSPFDFFFFGRYAERFFLFSNFCLFAGCGYLQLLHPGVAYYQLLYSQKKNPPKNLGSENCNYSYVCAKNSSRDAIHSFKKCLKPCRNIEFCVECDVLSYALPLGCHEPGGGFFTESK